MTIVLITFSFCSVLFVRLFDRPSFSYKTWFNYLVYLGQERVNFVYKV
jgi:hypothetical protein